MLVYSYFQWYCLHSTFNHMALVTFYDGRGDLSSCRLRLGCKPCKPCKLGEIGLEPRYSIQTWIYETWSQGNCWWSPSPSWSQINLGWKVFFCFLFLYSFSPDHRVPLIGHNCEMAREGERQNSNLIGADTNWAIKPILDLKYCRLWVLTYLNSFQVPFRRPELHLSFSLRATNPLNPPTAA